MKKANVKCIKLLSSALSPDPVIVAKFPKGPTYVLLTYEDRGEITRKLDVSLYAPREVWPRLLREHHLDAESGVYDVGTENSEPGKWGNCESLWVRVDQGESVGILYALQEWRQKNEYRDGSIHAPSWRCLTAVRKLALAAGLRDPAKDTQSHELYKKGMA